MFLQPSSFKKEINMQISVLATSVATLMNKQGKPYQQLEVSFKNLTFGKVESKKLMPFGAQEGAFKALSGAKQGDVFEVTVVKNAAGFNDWTACVQAAPDAAPQGLNSLAGAIIGTGSINKGVQVKSTYETPEERNKKQIYIIRQSSLSNAISTLSCSVKPGADKLQVEDVISLAESYYSWVMETPEQTVKKDLFDMPNDVEVE